MSVEEILRYAFERFDENDYDGAIKAFMAAHHSSDDEEQKNDILGVINELFILPKEKELEANYSSNIEILVKNGHIYYEKVNDYYRLPCKIIPISDERFYVWDEVCREFWGSECLDTSIIIQNEECEFDSIIIDGFADLRLILKEITSKRYANVYLVNVDTLDRDKLLSFFVIPSIVSKYMDNVYLFDDRSKLFDFLHETGNYIPRTLKVFSDFDYSESMSRLHEIRINEPKKNKPFLSICIPTINRGKKALGNVKRLKELLFDEEIEIIISNNSSVKELEYYDEIRKLAENDSRIIYKEMPSDSYAQSIENVILLPSADRALYCSDEDYMYLEKLGDAIDCIYKNKDIGLISFGTVVTRIMGYYLGEEPCRTEPGYYSTILGYGSNYITGLCLDLRYIRKRKLVKFFHNSLKNKNEYYMLYTHCVYAAYVAQNGGTYTPQIALFFDSTSDNDSKGVTENRYSNYGHILPEARIKQADSQIEVFLSMGFNEDDNANGIFYFIKRIYQLLRVGYGYYYAEINSLHKWQETCQMVFEYSQQVLKKIRGKIILDDALAKEFEARSYNLYIEELENEPIEFK